MQNKILFSSIFLKGFSSVIIQTLLLRELLVIFQGNELTFGLILCVWLISGALGSWAAGFIFQKAHSLRRPFVFFQFLLSLWLPFALYLIRASHMITGSSITDVFSLGGIMVLTSSVLGILAFSDGALFTVGFQFLGSLHPKENSPIAKIYLLESLGVIAGGILFTLYFVGRFNSFQIALFISVSNTCAGLFLLSKDKNLSIIIFAFLVFLTMLFLLKISDQLQQKTLLLQWKGRNIIVDENSPYANIAVSQEGSQYTILYDGLPLMSLPSPETYFTEDFIHIPLLTKPDAKYILMIGNAAGGLLREVLKYPVKKVVYVEIDPVLIKTLLALKDATIQQELKNPRVHIVRTDARNFIKTSPEKFDAVFVNTALPTSLVINRYYTQTFFQDVNNVLAENGIAVFKTWGSLSALSKELKILNASYLKTLASIFAYYEVIPGDGFNLFIASKQKQNFDPGFMARNYERLNLKTYLINPEYLSLRLQRSYRDWFYANIKNQMPNAIINEDLKPTGLYEGLSLYYAQYSKKIARGFEKIKGVKPLNAFFSLLCFLLLWGFWVKKKKRTEMALRFTIFSTGLFAMSAQIISLFLFQSLFGCLFQWLALLTASFMAGASAGAYGAIKELKTLSNLKRISQAECIFPSAAVLLIFANSFIFNKLLPPEALPWFFSLISICAGFLVGLEIPVVYAIIQKTIIPCAKESSSIAGQLYGLDLLGACLGAIGIPLVFLPSCGIGITLGLLGLLKIGNAGILSLLRKE